jgi:integrase
VLREWRLACPRFAEGDEAPRLWLVFPTATGNVQRLAHIRRRLGPLQVAAGISTDPSRPKYGMHSLRHYACSSFIEAGFSIKAVQTMMGHSSATMSLDVYGHLLPQPEDDQSRLVAMQARLVG